MTASRLRQLRLRIDSQLAMRLSPQRTRRATSFERLTVRRLSWDLVVRCNRYLEVGGRIATAIWVCFVVSLVLGFDWKEVVRHAVNSGKPVKGALVLAVVVPTLIFLVARSAIGFARWRLQRELWRRDVERLEAGE